mmetsp:Transcript_32747/g.104485  ORF Transcript_32747/g.104485 Transcript_32747/m.104485 type:complete len:112 (+) Transcript_32747:34-369(+)
MMSATPHAGTWSTHQKKLEIETLLSHKKAVEPAFAEMGRIALVEIYMPLAVADHMNNKTLGGEMDKPNNMCRNHGCSKSEHVDNVRHGEQLQLQQNEGAANETLGIDTARS